MFNTLSRRPFLIFAERRRSEGLKAEQQYRPEIKWKHKGIYRMFCYHTVFAPPGVSTLHKFTIGINPGTEQSLQANSSFSTLTFVKRCFQIKLVCHDKHLGINLSDV